MREIHLYGSEGGEIEANRSSLPLSAANRGGKPYDPTALPLVLLLQPNTSPQRFVSCLGEDVCWPTGNSPVRDDPPSPFFKHIRPIRSDLEIRPDIVRSGSASSHLQPILLRYFPYACDVRGRSDRAVVKSDGLSREGVSHAEIAPRSIDGGGTHRRGFWV
jgi:hypothetical protein